MNLRGGGRNAPPQTPLKKTMYLTTKFFQKKKKVHAKKKKKKKKKKNHYTEVDSNPRPQVLELPCQLSHYTILENYKIIRVL